MSSNTTNDTLVAGELAAVRALLTFQGAYGVGVKQLATVDAGNYFGSLNSLAGVNAQLQNPQFQGWYNQLYTLLMATNTVYHQPFPALYIVYAYTPFCDVNMVLNSAWKGYWSTFLHGYAYTIDGNDVTINPWGQETWLLHLPPRPTAPAVWKQATDNLLTKWGDAPPANILHLGTGGSGGFTYDAATYTFQQSVLANWSDFAQVAVTTAPMWQAQQSTMTALLQQTALTADAYFFLLHLLIALPTGATSAQQLAQRIVSASATSQEYPNDTFINQLVYLAMLYLADPLGAYGWNNAQLQAVLQALEGAILASDSASAAIKGSLVQHGKVLYSDSAYPMQDPYSPNIGFTQRKSDTLFALDKARQTLHTT
ncbi:MAG TPA: hypothetical protein VFU78_07930 [Thermomicrobiales bacterium]|nr:hypothetical protein [Thermomicrobiales bacterium]